MHEQKPAKALRRKRLIDLALAVALIGSFAPLMVLIARMAVPCFTLIAVSARETVVSLVEIPIDGQQRY